MILAALPVALVGGVLAAFAGKRVVSVGSLVGIITGPGIAARNGILRVQHDQHDQHCGTCGTCSTCSTCNRWGMKLEARPGAARRQ